jgi:hypothetical protein
MTPDIASRASEAPAAPLRPGQMARSLRVPAGLAWIALAFCLAKTCVDTAAMWTLFPDYPLWRPAATAFSWNLTLTVALLLAMAAAERSTGSYGHIGYRYVAAGAGAALIGTALGAALEYGLHLECCYEDGHVPTFFGIFAGGITMNLMICELVAAAFVYRRNALARLQSLHGAQLELAELAKQTHEAGLQAMQARVEPQFLFSTLTQVEQLYEHDPPRAGRMLDELIVYLRAALPNLRDTSSTVEKEIALGQAFINIARIRFDDELTCEIAVAAEARDARFPPMVLLPLIDHVVGTIPPRHLRIDATVVASKVHVLIRWDRRAGAHGTVIETLRDRLRALFGDDARIEQVRADADDVQIAVEVPYEPT